MSTDGSGLDEKPTLESEDPLILGGLKISEINAYDVDACIGSIFLFVLIPVVIIDP